MGRRAAERRPVAALCGEGSMTAAQNKTYEQRLADLVRRLASDYEGEVIASVGALKRLLASRNVDFTDLANAIEQPGDRRARGGGNEAPLRRRLPEGPRRLDAQAGRGAGRLRPASWTAPTTGKQSRSFANARRRASTPSIISSSTTWPRASCGAASRRRSRGRTCSACFASSAGG